MSKDEKYLEFLQKIAYNLPYCKDDFNFSTKFKNGKNLYCREFNIKGDKLELFEILSILDKDNCYRFKTTILRDYYVKYNKEFFIDKIKEWFGGFEPIITKFKKDIENDITELTELLEEFSEEVI